MNAHGSSDALHRAAQRIADAHDALVWRALFERPGLEALRAVDELLERLVRVRATNERN